MRYRTLGEIMQDHHFSIIDIFRSNLETAQTALDTTQTDLRSRELELSHARNNLSSTNNRLGESERSIALLKENRWDLLSRKV